jgi:protein phosphatase
VNIGLRYAARSDVGLVRANNQDSAYAGSHLLMVADGMGGHAGGDVASSLAVATFAPLDDEALGPDDALAELDRAMVAARDAIVERSAAEPDVAGMGTTVTAILRTENKLAMAHIGDSRCYLMRDGELSQVTVDHTFVQHLVDIGRITPEEAEHHPQRSVVMKVLGDFDVDITPDLSVREAVPGDRWLLCSDGLSGFVSADTIAETLAEQTDVDACADLLVQLALRAGGGDNVTVIVADVVDLDEVADGAAPTTAITVVGAAALSRNRPTSAADGPAARAAHLARRLAHARPDGDAAGAGGDGSGAGGEHDEAAAVGGPTRRALVVVWAMVLVAVIAGLTGGYLWTQGQYFVGASEGHVAVFRGVPATIGPLELSSVVEVSETELADLPPYLGARFVDTTHAATLAAPRSQVEMLAETAAPTPTPRPTPTRTPAPTATPTFTVEPLLPESIAPPPSPPAGA